MKTVVAVPVSETFEADADAIDFESWMIREQRRVYLLCLRLLRNEFEADSAVQDVFIKAFRAIERNGKRPIRDRAGWLTRVAVNTCIDRLHSGYWKFWRRRISSDNEQNLLTLVPAPGLNQEETLIERERFNRLAQSLGRLSPRQRAVFVLRHDEGMNLAEIAGVMGLDEGTVKAHMARAVRKLRGELRDVYAK
jgi:RNA polymerase sigma-70 factor (ECF subfamily)